MCERSIIHGVVPNIGSVPLVLRKTESRTVMLMAEMMLQHATFRASRQDGRRVRARKSLTPVVVTQHMPHHNVARAAAHNCQSQ